MSTRKTVPLSPGLCMAIGSMPHTNPYRAVDLIREACPEAPCWPQLPNLGFQEDMMVQFTEGLPCLEIAHTTRSLFFRNPNVHVDEVTRFYEAYLEAEASGQLDHFSISPQYAQGLYAFAQRLSEERPEPHPILKGQVTGPLTFGLSVKDEQGTPAFFDDTLADIIQKTVIMKALWQVTYLSRYARSVIIFVDEPILAAFGSAAFINVSREAVVSSLGAVCTQIKASGAIVGSHCCGNTDWSLLVDAGVDIINFDAYAYLESISLYADALARFFDKEGHLAWGIVPSAHVGKRPGVDDLFDMLTRGIDLLVSRGIPRTVITHRLLLTPSCGLGTLGDREAEAILKDLSSLSRVVRNRLITA